MSENCFKVPEDGVGTSQERVRADAVGHVYGAHPITIYLLRPEKVPKQKVHNSWKCICMHLLHNTGGLPGKAWSGWEARAGDVSLYTLLYL